MTQQIEQVTEKNSNEPAVAQAIDKKKSVKKDDYAVGTQTFVFPAYGQSSFLYGDSSTLPPKLPKFSRQNFQTARDRVLLRTVHHEAMWANAIATAVTKAASWGWEIEGGVPLRRKRVQELLQYATAGVFMGWVPFLTAHLRSYLMCGYGIVEVVRERNSYSSRITGLNHLNPLRCRFTDNPRKPVDYLDRSGRIHRLNYWDVMMLADQVDPTEGDMNHVNSAGERAYDHITTMEATHIYLYEKITGNRPLALEFIQGLNETRLKDGIQSSEHDKERKGSIMFRGVIAIPVPGDVPIQRVTIPIAEVPDGFQYQEIHDNTTVVYAGAIGMDVNDLDPRLASRGSFGSGAQSIVLNQKASGKGLSSWREDWTQQMHRLVNASGTKFAWSEQNLDDEEKKARIAGSRTQTRKLMQEIGEIDQAQSRNMAVDAGDLPKEMLDAQDVTPGGRSDSADNPEAQPEKIARETGNKKPELKPTSLQTAVPGEEPTKKPGEKKKEITDEEEAMRLLEKTQLDALQNARQVLKLPATVDEWLGVAD